MNEYHERFQWVGIDQNHSKDKSENFTQISANFI